MAESGYKAIDVKSTISFMGIIFDSRTVDT